MLSAVLLVAALAQPAEDLRPLVRDALAFLEQSQDHYGYAFEMDRKEFDSSGKQTGQEKLIGRKEFEEGYAVFRVLEKNGRPLDEKERAKQEEKIRKHVAEQKALTPAEREKRRRKAAQDDAFLKEIPDALEFKFVREETIGGRPAVVLSCSPRPGYEPKSMRARLFEKIRGTLWIDRADRQLVRAEAETFDAVNMGLGILGRVQKGTRFAMARKRLPDGAWVPEEQRIRFGARIMLVKWVGNELVMRLSDHRLR